MADIDFLKLWNMSAGQYHRYSTTFRQYIETNRKMVEFSRVSPGDVVVDLACGTGLTTRTILEMVPDVRRIYAIDFSESMIKKAKEVVDSDKVVFIVSPAENIRHVIDTKVDQIVCNSAFWQFNDKDRVIGGAAEILKPGGMFTFNLNQQFFDFGSPEPAQKRVIDEIFLELERRGYRPSRKIVGRIGMDEIEKMFNKHGFILEDTETIDIGPRPLEEILEFFKIPATGTFFDGVPNVVREEILSSVWENLSRHVKAIEHNKWIYFRFSKA